MAGLLAAAMHLLGQVEAFLLLPPYRPALRELLRGHVVGEFTVAGPMVRSASGQPPTFWIDGLDSV